jgi:tetratricopeptide (TPR) repeat protein
MEKLIIYSLEVAISLALFYSIYFLFLKHETFFKLNRFYLVFSVIISLLIPLPGISVGGDSLISKYLVAPIDQYEYSFNGNDELWQITSSTSEERRKMMHNKTADAVNVKGSENTTLTTSQTTSSETNDGPAINWISIGLVIYLTGVLLLFIRFIANIIWILAFVRKHRPIPIHGLKVIRSKNDFTPFSFLNYVFIGQKEYPDEELAKILSHEKIHIRQKHTIDLIFLELVLMFQWFNPFAWFYKRAFKINHEYLADEGTLNSGIDLSSYQYSLLNQVLSQNNFEMSSSYNLSVKKRIAMMLQRRSSKLSAFKMMLVIPLFFLLFGAFGFNSDPNPTAPIIKTSLTPPDTSIKEVSVTREYLKLLEGEYIAIKGPWRERTIIFTELLGYLYGFDAGYNYKIIPVGDESFINPDDKASLVFNSKDKNAISLLLFERITLKKQSFASGSQHLRKRTMGFTMANVMLQRGVQAGLDFYKAAKDSANYITSEGQLNYAGYVLMQAGKLNEAAAIFKLNTELYPESFNTYDSYGEVLLNLGDKAQAIENYKKSVVLNPGSKSGLEHLQQLGVNINDVVKKVNLSESELRLIEGDYISTNEKHWTRWIHIESKDGTLFGTDNGYRYRLIPMGNGKFINPDDGVSLVFNTENKNAITFTLFGIVNLKKVKTVKESEVDLNKYAGLYLPPKGDTIQKPAEIVVRDNKLYRIIPSDPEGPNKMIELKLVTGNHFFYTDNSARSIEFVVDGKKHVTSFILRRPEAQYTLIKQ